MSGSAEIVACVTCGSSQRDSEGRTRGERLLNMLHAAGAHTPDISISSVRCLWACKQSCAVHVRAPGKPGYVLSSLEPDEETARALLAYATSYAESSEGAVPFKSWPAALRGHFLCRIPALPPPPAAPPPVLPED